MTSRKIPKTKASQFSSSTLQRVPASEIRKKRRKRIIIFLLLLILVLAVVCACILYVQKNTQQQDGSQVDSQTIEQLSSGNVYTLGSAQSASQSSEQGRITNISIASSDLNNRQIAPGETLSVNDILHDTSKDTRYALAPAFNGEGSNMERGGGVCQVVSTLYIAAIQAGLEIVERHPHSIAVDYTSMGLDATVSYGNMDLKIKNNYNRTVFLQLSSVGQTANASIVCFEPCESETTSRKLSSEIVNNYSDDKATGVTYYEVKAYLATYVQGQMTKKEQVSDDTYRATNATS